MLVRVRAEQNHGKSSQFVTSDRRGRLTGPLDPDAVAAPPRFVRRSDFLVVFWAQGGLVIENYATGVRHAGTAAAMEVLDLLGKWTATEELAKALSHWDPVAVHEIVAELADLTLLEAGDRAPHAKERALSRWEPWNPMVGFYHMATKDAPYTDPDQPPKGIGTLLWHPEHLKKYPDSARLELPEFPRDDGFPEVLLQRRTWRHFGDRQVTLDELSTLLGLTWGVQMWVHGWGDRPSPFKTSPSGGARHSLEAYVLAWDVEGVDPGTYHYCPDTHSLAVLETGTPISVLEDFVPQQKWFHRPAAVVFMTSVFERVHSKYRHPRAYRVLHLEAGHFSQTFCLVATWLGLAPFLTTALGDTAIERHLGIDGVDESVIHAVGVGSRPPGLDWAPHYQSLEPFETSLPEYARRGEAESGEEVP